MGLELTTAARAALDNTVKEPNIVLSIDGIGTLFGAAPVYTSVRVGDGSIIGDPELQMRAFYVGGQSLLEDQENAIMLSGTSTNIRQQLDPFKGQGTSVSTLSVALVDDGTITEMITPGERVTDIIQRQAIVRFGFSGTDFPADYVIVFRGFITSISSDAGTVTFQLNGADEKKRTNLFKQAEADLTQALTASSTTPILLTAYDNFLSRIQGPDGTFDPSFKSYVRIDDEIIQYQTVSSGLTGITRGALGTVAAAHTAGTKVETFYRLTGNAMDLALKLMASGLNTSGTYDPSILSVEVTSINVGGPDYQQNSLYFASTDVSEQFGLVVGDYVHAINGSVTSGNNVQKKRILDIIQGQAGDFIVVDSPLTDDISTGVTASFVSQFNTLPDGCKMAPDEIDVDEHLRLRRLFLSSANYDFYLKETIDNARDFIEQQIYLPMAAYSLPRKARASVGYQIGPIPGDTVVIFDQDNIKSPNNIKIDRSTNTNFYNEVIYKYDDSVLEDEFQSGFITISETSKNRIKNSPNRSLVIEAKGLRTNLDAEAIIKDKSARRLFRYQFGAEQFTFQTLLENGFSVEIGDIVNFDGRTLMLPDIRRGQKGIAPRLLEITNKEFQLKTGDIKFTAVDTNADGSIRYGLISPSSQISVALSPTEFWIISSYSQRFGAAEYRKWSNMVGGGVRVRSTDYSIVGESTFVSVSNAGRVKLSDPLPFTPSLGMVMELVPYTSSRLTAMQKLIYASFSADNFADGTPPYAML